MSPTVIARLSGLIVTGLGVAACILARRLPAQSGFGLGPAFLPFWTGVVLAGSGLWLCARGAVDGEISRPTARGFGRVACGFVLLLLYMLLLQPLGYLVSTVIFLVVGILLLEPLRPGRAIFFGFASAGLLFLIFSVWLRIPLPGGVLGW